MQLLITQKGSKLKIAFFWKGGKILQKCILLDFATMVASHSCSSLSKNQLFSEMENVLRSGTTANGIGARVLAADAQN